MTGNNIDINKLKKDLEKEDSQKINDLISHLTHLQTAKKKDGSLSYKWVCFLTNSKIIELYKKAINQKLHIDGKHITIENRGGKIQLSYDYIAYKNRLLTIYPEAKFDFNVVYKSDDFSIAKKDGKVFYHHKINDPFSNKDSDVIGVYCIIKIITGDFFITLDREEINQLRKKATTDYIWKDWFKDMCIKSAIKKIVSKHFDDVYREINDTDNESINLNNPIDIELKLKQEIEAVDSLIELNSFYNEKKGDVENQKSFINMLAIRKAEIKSRDNDIQKKYLELAEIKNLEIIEDFDTRSYQEKLDLFNNIQSQ